MEAYQINPYLRSAAFFNWSIIDSHRNISYHRRIFAFRKNPAHLHIDGQTYDVPAESLLILAPGVPYRFLNTEADHPFMLYCCQLDLSNDLRYRQTYNPSKEADFQPDKIVDVTDPPKELLMPLIVRSCPELCEQIRQVYDLSGENAPFAAEIISGILKTVLFQAMKLCHIQNTDSIGHGSDTARKTMQYIREHASERITITDVAEVMNFHPYYLARLFRQHYGITPYRYLMQCRMEHAVHLLRNTDMPISAVAAACGFSTQSHFAAFIRREVGISASTFRENMRGNEGIV